LKLKIQFLKIVLKIKIYWLRIPQNCNLNTISKMVSAPSFRLKGGGWYETDFKTGTKKNIALDDKKNESSSKKSNKQDKITKKNSKDKKVG